MVRQEDPEGLELQTIFKHISFKDKDILEMGCGDGRLTLKYAHLTKRVVAIDPDNEEIEKARKILPRGLAPKIEFQVEKAEKLPFPNNSYDIIFFTHSLCCISPVNNIITSLNEAWRILKPEGILVNLMDCFHQPFNSCIIKYLLKKRPEDLVFGYEEISDAVDARYALIHVSLVEKKFQLIVEEDFEIKIYYDSIEEALDTIKGIYPEEYSNIDDQTKQEIHRILNSSINPKGIMNTSKIVVSLLRKH